MFFNLAGNDLVDVELTAGPVGRREARLSHFVPGRGVDPLVAFLAEDLLVQVDPGPAHDRHCGALGLVQRAGVVPARLVPSDLVHLIDQIDELAAVPSNNTTVSQHFHHQGHHCRSQ